MKAMTTAEAKDWCSQVGLHLSSDGLLGYASSLSSQGPKFFVLAPEEFRRISVFTRSLLNLPDKTAFGGGLLWLRRWDIGSPPLIWAGWRIIESIRKVSGGSESLEVAPAQLFRADELVEFHACLIPVVGFGWVAEFVPSTGGFFLHFKDNRQVCFSAESTDLLNELRTAFRHCNPTDDDPMVKRLAELARPGGHSPAEEIQTRFDRDEWKW